MQYWRGEKGYPLTLGPTNSTVLQSTTSNNPKFL